MTNQPLNSEATKGTIEKTAPLLTASNLSVVKGQRTLLDNISLHLEKGELLGLIGPNGAGKSSLLMALAQLSPYQGKVCYQEKNVALFSVSERARLIAYLQQSTALSWPLTVRDYVALGRTPYRAWLNRAEKKQREQDIINSAIEQTGLGKFTNQRVDQLSGGEFARVRLARALAVDTPLLLVDEPVASLDPFHQLQVMELLKAQCVAGKSVMLALHDLTLASRFCDRLLLLDKGCLVAAGEPRKILTPANLQRVYQVKAMLGEHQQQAYVVPWVCDSATPFNNTETLRGTSL